MKKSTMFTVSQEDQTLYNKITEYLDTHKPDSALLKRLYAVRLFFKNIPVKEILSMLCLKKASLYRWIKTARTEGLEGLIRKEGSGRPPALVKEEKDNVDKVLLKQPEKHGFHLWEGKSLSEYISREFGKRISVRSAQRLLKDLNYSYSKPRSKPAPKEPNEQERDQFKFLIQEVNGDPSLILVWEDEVHFLVQAKTGKMWLKKGIDHCILITPGRDKTSYLGYLIPETGQLLAVQAERFTYETMIASLRTFLEECPLPEGKKYCIVFDNAPWHAKMYRLIWTEEQPEYEDIREQIVPVFLPKYSPDLNPIELIWRITRREITNNRTFPTKKELSDCLNTYFDEHREPNEQFKKAGSFSCYAYKNNNQSDDKSKIDGGKGNK